MYTHNSVLIFVAICKFLQPIAVASGRNNEGEYGFFDNLAVTLLYHKNMIITQRRFLRHNVCLKI